METTKPIEAVTLTRTH